MINLYPFIYLCVASAAVLLLIPSVARGLRNPLKKIPGPWYTQFTSIVLIYYHLVGQKPKYAYQLHCKYGPVVRISPTEVDVSSPAGAAEIHQVKRPYFKTNFYSQFIPGVQNVFNTLDREFYRRHRRLLSAPLSDNQLKMFWPQIEAKFDLALSRIGDEMTSRGAADVHKWFLYTATDVIGELSFGQSFNMLEKIEVNQYINDLRMIQTGSGIRMALPWIYATPLAKLLPVFRDQRYLLLRLQGYAGESLKRHRDLVDREGEDSNPTLLSRLYKADENGETLTPNEVRDEAMAYIVAGSDTTANTLTFLVWAVCRNTAVRDTLAKELASLPDDYTLGDLRDLPFLDHVIHEGFRVYAAAPGALPRYVPPEGAEIEGCWLPGGSTVMTSAYSLHRNAEVFPEPERFDPWRWENPTRDMKTAFMPFGGGPRICLGMHLAWLEIRLGAAKFFRAYPSAKVSQLEGMSDEDMIQEMYFLTAPKGHRCLIEAS